MANEFNIKNGFISKDNSLVEGRLTTQNLQITSGATNGYVLTSDASGNVIWTNPSSGYLEYRTNLTQTGTTEPIESILGVNTLTGGTWSYNDVGSYFFTKTGAFSAATKVEVLINPTIVYGYTMSNAGFSLISAAVVNDDVIEVRSSYWGVYPNTGSQSVVTPGSNGISASDAMSDDILNNTSFFVRVWL